MSITETSLECNFESRNPIAKYCSWKNDNDESPWNSERASGSRAICMQGFLDDEANSLLISRGILQKSSSKRSRNIVAVLALPQCLSISYKIDDFNMVPQSKLSLMKRKLG